MAEHHTKSVVWQPSHATLLVVEDDRSLAEMLRDLLSFEYRVHGSDSGESAIQQALQAPPDLILLDISLPDRSGLSVLDVLREQAKTRHLPVIMLSGHHDLASKLSAFQHYANDYLTKPFNNDELLARIRAHLWHARTPLLSPLTQLPGGHLVEYAIEQRLRASEPWAFIYLDLDHFKAINDAFGFYKGNKMIQMLTHIISDAVREIGNREDFVGHVGGEDFVVLTSPSRVHQLCSCIIRRFDQESQALYPPEDRATGTFRALGRDGEEHTFPFVTLSIAVILSHLMRNDVSIEELSQRAAWVKLQSKSIADHSYVIDGEKQVFVGTQSRPIDRATALEPGLVPSKE